MQLTVHDASADEIREAITHLRAKQRDAVPGMWLRYQEQIDALLDELLARRCG